MTTSEQINEIAAACANAQKELRPAAKAAENEAFKRGGKASRYSDLAAIIEAAIVYAKQDVAIFQDVTTNDSGVSVSTRMIHKSGQWLEFGPLTVPLSKRDAHGVGSAATYAKRYGLQSAALIPSDDDDGNAAVQGQEQKEKPKAATVPEGFDNWLADMETLAGDGTKVLQEAWKKSQPYFRKHLTDTNAAKWEALKARAVKLADGEIE